MLLRLMRQEQKKRLLRERAEKTNKEKTVFEIDEELFLLGQMLLRPELLWSRSFCNGAYFVKI